MTPYEHDMAWLELMRAVDKARTAVGHRLSTILSADDWRKDYNGDYWRRGNRGASTLITDAREQAIASLLASGYNLSYGKTGAQIVEAYTNAKAGAGVAEDALAEHEQGYTGWQRFFLVTSSNGLIHASMMCSTCNKGRKWTELALLPTLSGLPIANAVEVLGPSLCSVCFPDAPVAVVDGPKLPKSVTEVLFAKGPEAFMAALASYRVKAAAKATKKG